MPRAWWDDVPYDGSEAPLISMSIEAEPEFQHPCGFIRLRERYRVRALSRPLRVEGADDAPNR